MITNVIALIWLGIFCWQFGVRAGRSAVAARPFFMPKTDLSGVKEVKKYNGALAKLWYLYALFFLVGAALCINRQSLTQRMAISLGVGAAGLAAMAILYKLLVKHFLEKEKPGVSLH